MCYDIFVVFGDFRQKNFYWFVYKIISFVERRIDGNGVPAIKI